ncbi:2-hydroxyacid dehydrogenase [Pseudoalteromonas sp. BDTF-M6]|uniref:2-hydroxyacid dehydrogenase n=1 Tax=Pseudoalteromonas sp. BDTF-M6 TaxID=2796132 RepID=UPI001BB0992C|nr:2-hydroxyacid dehydrogenase [Pseudoalteromonas sp. BDTF-M6]MBS3796874.1 2-hydroxyacid dehydrogenase [Pseudoalteromonas sp. BDTF-M6]
MKLALFSSQRYEQTVFDELCPADVDIEYFDVGLNVHTCSLSKGFDAVCVFVNDNLNAEVIAKLADLGIGLILLRCAGFNNVDLAAAKAHNIAVARVPAYSPEAVAEHSIALMLTLARKTHKAYNRVREDNFDLNGLLGFNLHNKTVGLIGCGKIGQALVKILNGFGTKVLVCDPASPKGAFTLVKQSELLANSDIISLHCPLNEQTHHIINKPALATMKRGVMLINTGRGALLDTKACIEALKSGQLGYLGLDVYEQESELFFKDRSEEILQDDVFARLLTFKNVLITGHQGFFTQEALEQIVQTTYLNLHQFTKGDTLTNQVLDV